MNQQHTYQNHCRLLLSTVSLAHKSKSLLHQTMKCIVFQLVISATSLVHMTMALCDGPIDPKYLNLKHNGNTLYYITNPSPLPTVHHIAKSSRPIDPNSVIVNSPGSSSSLSSSSPLAELLAVWMHSLFSIHLALFFISKCLNHAKFLMECVNKNESHTNTTIMSSDNAPMRDVLFISPLLHSMLSQSTTPTLNEGMLKNHRMSSAAIECAGGIGYNLEGSSAFLDYSSGYESEVMMEGGGCDNATSKHNVSVMSSSAFLGEQSNAIVVYSFFKCNGDYARSWLPATSPNFANRTRLDVLPQRSLSFSPKLFSKS